MFHCLTSKREMVLESDYFLLSRRLFHSRWQQYFKTFYFYYKTCQCSYPSISFTVAINQNIVTNNNILFVCHYIKEFSTFQGTE